MPRISLIQIRKGTTAEWNSANPVLGSGEPGYDLDLNHLKLGDGNNNWNSIQPIGSSLHPNINASDSSDNNLANHFVRNLLLDENGHVTGIYVTNSEQIELSTDPSPQLGADLDTNGNNILFGDNEQAIFGDGSDLLIYHDGSNSFIDEEGTGSLNIRGPELNLKSSSNELYFQAVSDGSVSLYYDGSKKFETTATGVYVLNTLTSATGIHDTIDLSLMDELSSPTHQEGRLFYDSENHALVVYNEESEVTQQLGQEEYLRVRNNTGATITNGTPVIITGSHGNAAPTIAPANAASDINSRVVGIATHDIENNSFGYVTTYGIVRHIDTSSFSGGDEIFLSTTPGELTATCPVIPNYCVPIGYVIRSHAANGSVLVELGKHKLGGGDLKSEANLNLQGIPFVSTVGSDRSGGLLTDANLVYNSGVQELNLGTGGIRFSDGTTQTTSAGGVNKDYVSVTSHYTLTTDNDVVFVNSSAALVNVYIPTASGIGGKEIIVKKTVGSNNVVINTIVGTETIDGNSSFTITNNYESVTLISDNTNWFII